MLLHEDTELEEAALSGDFDVIVPVSIYVPAEGEPEITAYNIAWDICAAYEAEHRDDLLDRDALRELCGKISPAVSELGYGIDLKGSRVILEYRVSEVTPAIADAAAGSLVIRSTEEIEGLACPLLHHPEPDEFDERDACAVVIKDGVICACAGVNDLADDDSCEIFVETAPEFRRKGYGCAAVAALAKHLCDLGEEVAYNCAEDNVASSGIAKKLGMTYTGKRFSVICYSGEIIDT